MIARTLMRSVAISGTVVALSLSLGGCISLLPKEKPAQLYRFGGPASAANTESASINAPPRSVVLGQIGFPREATTDGILTVTGTQTAYIAGVRWVAPAAVLFRQAVPAAFDVPASRTRVLNRGELGAAAGVLELDVAKFEVDYSRGGGEPTVSVLVRARLTKADGSLIGERNVDVEQPVAANRVSAIVPAFDTAVRAALGQVVTWTDQGLDANPPTALPPMTKTTSTTSQSTTTTTRPR